MKEKNSPNADVAQTLELDHSSGRRNRRKRWFILIIIAAVLVTCIVVWKKKQKLNSVQYETRQAERGSLTIIVTATGTLEPTNEVDVGSEQSGIVDTVEVDYNDRVVVDQVLARLDTTKLDAEVTQAKAALESAKAKVLQAQATVNETRNKLEQYYKVRELSDNKVPSRTELDAAEAAFERAKADEASAKAAVSQAQATLETIQTDLSKTIIRSPINGIVLTRSIEPGQTVAAAFEAPVLFTLADDLTKMELHVDVDEADIGQVKEGQDAVFTVDAYPDRPFQAKIIQTRYGSQTVDGVVTYETVLKVENSDLSLRPGMTATADITVKKVEDAVLIPNNALRFSPPVQKQEGNSRGLVGALLPGPPRHETKELVDEPVNKSQQRVWMLNNGTLTSVDITVGSSDGIMTEILNGDIEPGTELVVDTITQGK